MKGLLAGLLVLAACAVLYVNSCPCNRIPGAWLLGTQAEAPVTDWSFANDRESAPLCQLQINTWRPHSINANCMADNGQLYVSCSNCAGKYWSQSALTHPAGQIRIAGSVYPVTYTRVTDPAELDLAWNARLNKIAREPSPRPDHWWSFKLASR